MTILNYLTTNYIIKVWIFYCHIIPLIIITWARLIVPSVCSNKSCHVHITQDHTEERQMKLFLDSNIVFFHQLLLETIDEQNTV